MSDEDADFGDLEESEAVAAPEEESLAVPEAKAVIGTIIPLHAATGGDGLKRGRGRPKKINPKPTTQDLLYHAEMMRQKAAFIDADPLVQSTRSRQEAIEVLQRVKEEVAREAASLHFTRIEEEKYGKDTSQMSSRRIGALREVASIELEIKKLGVASIDLKGERFQKVFKYLIDCIREAVEEVSTPEQLDLIFNRLETKLEGWEDRAQDIVK
jgi:hypothetical protein